MEKSNIYRRDINLVDRVTEKVFKSNPKGTFIIIMAILIIALILAGIFIPKIILSAKEDRLKALNSQLAANDAYEREYNEIIAKEDDSKVRIDELEVFDQDIANHLLNKVLSYANGITFSKITITNDNQIHMDGSASTDDAVYRFFYGIGGDDEITGVRFEKKENEADANLIVKTNFTISAEYELAKEESAE